MKKKSENLLVILVTIAIITFLSVSDIAQAVRVGIEASTTTVTETLSVSFIAYVDINTNERIPLENLTLTIGSDSCTFEVDGTEISGTLCTSITITPNNNLAFTTGERWGYDYWEGVNYTFNPGFGYEDNSRVYTSSPFGELSYTIVWTTPEVDVTTAYTVAISSLANSTVAYSKTYTNLITVENYVASSGSPDGSSPSSSFIGSSSGPSLNPSYYWSFSQISPTNPGIANFNILGLDISQVEVIPNKVLNNVRLKITRFDALPNDLTQYVGKIYRYMAIEVDAADRDLSQARIRFKINSSWVSVNNIKNITLLRFHNNRWDAVQTRRVSSTEYESMSPGLSYFAIGEQMTTLTQQNVSIVEQEPEPELELEPFSNVSEEPQPTQQTKSPVQLFIFGGIILLLILLILVGGFAKKLWSQRKIGGFKAKLDEPPEESTKEERQVEEEPQFEKAVQQEPTAEPAEIVEKPSQEELPTEQEAPTDKLAEESAVETKTELSSESIPQEPEEPKEKPEAPEPKKIPSAAVIPAKKEKQIKSKKGKKIKESKAAQKRARLFKMPEERKVPREIKEEMEKLDHLSLEEIEKKLIEFEKETDKKFKKT